MEFRGSTGGRQRRRGTSREVRDPQHNMHVVAQLKVTNMTPSVTTHYEVCRPQSCRAPTFQGILIHKEEGGLQGFFYWWLNWQTLRGLLVFDVVGGKKCTNTKSGAPLSALICHVPPSGSQLVARFLLLSFISHSLSLCLFVICFFFCSPLNQPSQANVQSRTRQQQTLTTEEGGLFDFGGRIRQGSGWSAWLAAQRLTAEIFTRQNSSVGQRG